MYDFTKVGTAQLLRQYQFHSADCGTTTMDEECKRMYLVQEIGAELERRGQRLPRVVEWQYDDEIDNECE